jgi:hypothetical protein
MNVAKKKTAKTILVGGVKIDAPGEGRKLYIAYGSNLHVKKMAERCPDAKQVDSIMLTDCRLVFRGVADLEYAPGEQVPVGVWDISAKDEVALDRYEGYPAFYGKYEMPINGTEHKALVYLMVDREGVMPPSAWYANIIADGYRHFDLDLAYLHAAVRHSFQQKNPSEQTRARRKRQINSTHQSRLVAMPREVMEKRLDDRLKQAQTALLYEAVPEVTLLDYAETAEEPVKREPRPANGATFKRMTIDDYRRESAERDRELYKEQQYRKRNMIVYGD